VSTPVEKVFTNLDFRGREIKNAVLNGATIQTVDTFPENPSAGMLVVHSDQIYMYGDHVSDGNLSWSRIASYARVNLVENRLQGHINDEAARAEAAEAALQSSIDTAAATAQTNLQDAIASEASARTQDVTGLQSSIESILVTNSTLSNEISTEASDRSAADTALGGRIDSEVSRATGAEMALGGRIDGVSSDVSGLSARVDLVSGELVGESSRASAAETDLGNRISSVSSDLTAEVARATAAEAALTSSITSGVADAKSYAATAASDAQAAAANSAAAYTDQKIADLIDGAPDALNTLREITTQLATDESAVTALTNVVSQKATASSISLGSVTGEFSVTVNHSFSTAYSVQVMDEAGYAVWVSVQHVPGAVIISGDTGSDTETLTAHIVGH
jgi:hypothetical protein